jgi:AraC-like DNA-binding protein
MDQKKQRNRAAWSLNRTFVIILLFIPFILLIFPAIDLATRTHTAFPTGDIRPNIFAFDDKLFKGDSQIESFSYTSQELILNYRLRPGAQFPMVFINFSLGTAENPFDLSGIESVAIDIGGATVKSILLFFQTFVPGISRPGMENALTLRPSQYSLEFTPGVRNYTVAIQKFVTEPWWLATANPGPRKLPLEDYKRVVNFSIMLNQDSSSYIFDKPEQIVIKRLAFNKSISNINLSLLIGVVFLYSVFYSLQLAQSIRNCLIKVPAQKPVQVVTYHEHDLGRIKEFIETHYCDPDISANMIYQKLGIPRTRVSKLLTQEYHLTFKQIINKMRIEEAKRLVKQTDLRIIDISLTLGFQNVTHFNYVFKEQTGMSPSEFKEKKL